MSKRMRAVLYARVSGDDRKNEGRNLEGQIEMCRKFAQEKQWSIVKELAEDDRGASGASFELPILNEVREMARAGEFDVLVVREIDRLSRKLAKQLVVEEELSNSGVQIEYVLGDYPDTPEGNLMKHVRATIAEYEREKINERMIRGRRQKIRSGSIVSSGRMPYGYQAVDKNGETTLEVIQPQAKVIRMIYHWYTSGPSSEGPLSIRAIAARLTEMSIPTFGDLHPHKTYRKKRAALWNPNSVRRILTNETYAGVWTYGKNSEMGSLAVEVPAIVDRDTWETAQSRRKKNKRLAKRNRKHEYLLSGHIRCGHCLTSMSGGTFYPDGKRYQYYICNVKRSPKLHDTVCDLPSFRVEFVDEAIWEWIESVIFDPNMWKKGWEAFQMEQEQANVPLRERIEIVEGLLADHREQYQRLLDLYLTGDIPREMLAERKSSLETTIRALTDERKDLTSRLQSNQLTPDQLEDMQVSILELAEELLTDDGSYDMRRRILDLLSVDVSAAIEKGEKVLYARCVLTGKNFVNVTTAICGSCRCRSRPRSPPG